MGDVTGCVSGSGESDRVCVREWGGVREWGV